MPLPLARPMTVEEFWKLPDDGRRYELWEGVLEVTPSPNTSHQRIVGNLFYLLETYLRVHPVGEVWPSPLDVELSHLTVWEPDVVFVRAERVKALVDRHIKGPPDLVVEVLSPGSTSRDHIKKRASYERYGIGEYWIVDPAERSVSRYTLEGDRFLTPEFFEGDTSFASPLFPDLEVRLDEIFRGID